ncbi:MAG: tRNA (adenosine(37)-N6)-threonylcarbamoyltransferase complex ATPase subunit type 1 TsaE [Betaproteobacteria bacterium RIFCSPLOWO2_12_FULL_64_23]|nr:MAG: tRNA (adenosine(37)-N6)-threonylcarbamoyltransferase complex ATPase subunit type 1 TsaE [Betaproteobacteria bacterium RIFCSPLOWO2_12_FULL_64_23]
MSNHNHSTLEMHLADEAATRALGARLARVIMPGLLLYLHGDLGSGKTTFARGLLRGLGYTGRVKSPTYTLVELYTVSRLNLYHFDFYRFRNPKEWRDAGFNEYFNGASVCLVEWPEKAGGLLPVADLDIALGFAGNGRDLSIRAGSESGNACLNRLLQLPP